MINKKYWLRGGLLVVIAYIIITVILIPFGTPYSGCIMLCFPNWFWPTLLGSLIITIPFHIDIIAKYEFLFFIFASASYFSIGMVAGWIYGKIKNRKI